MNHLMKIKIYLILILVSTTIYTSPISFLKENLGNIKPYYKDLLLPNNLGHLFYSKEKKLFRDILLNYLKDNPKNITNYRIKFLLGYHYYRSKEYNKATEQFRSIVGRYNELNDYIFFYLGDSYRAQKKLVDAYQAYSLVTSKSIFSDIAVKNKLNILFKLKQYIHIKNFFQKESHYLENDALNFLFIKTLIQLGDEDTAILQLKKVWSHTEGKEKKRAENILIDFMKKGKRNSIISGLEYYNRCEYLLQKKKYNTIIKDFELSYSVRKDVNIDKDICLLKASVYSNKLKSIDYINRLNHLPFKLSKIQKYYLDYIEMLYIFNQEEYQDYINKSLITLKEYKDYPNNEKLYIKLIESYKKLKKEKKYYKYLKKYVSNEEFVQKRKEYLYKLWFHYYDIKNYKESLKYIKIYEKIRFDNLRDEVRNKYYIARLNINLKNKKRGLYQYFKLILEDPFNYYSYLALIHLQKMNLTKEEILFNVKKVKKDITSLKKEKLHFNNRVLKIYELITLNLRQLAIKELIFYQQTATSENSLLANAFFFKSLRLYRSSRSVKFKSLRKIAFFPNKYSFISFWKSFYPLKYAISVNKHSKRFKVDPYFSWGILREESAYNRYAKSHSNAYGLMQLLYPTAVETANRIGMKLNNYRDLYVPDTNIALGVKYLAVLLRMFKGNRFYAAASYNAGASNVKHWLKNHHADNLYDWCEKIPVEQTNKYIYKVIGAEHSYNILYTRGYFKIGKVNLFKAIFSKDKK